MKFSPHPKRYFSSPFTPEKWQEIYEARSRLEAYKLKVQPYPEYPDTQPETKIPENKPWSREQWNSVQQTRAMCLHLQKKVAELYEKKKPKGKYD